MKEVSIGLVVIVFFWAFYFIVRLKNSNKALRNQIKILESENDQLERTINYYKAVNRTLSDGLNHFFNKDKK